jgi:hypothetical protein
MKRSILLFTAVAGIFYLTLSSYEDGPAIPGGQGNRTGSSGGTPTCSGVGCHGANITTTSISISLTDKVSGKAGTGHYVGGRSYVVALAASNSTAVKYGFQASIVKAVNQQAGTLAPGANQHLFTAGSGSTLVTGVEHSQPINVAAGSGGLAVISFDWTAPPAGMGQLTLYAIVNATNGNSQADASDHATPVTFPLSEWPASVSELSDDIKITAYPNPATSQFNLRFEGAERGQYTVKVIDLTGRQVYSEDIAVNGSQASTTIQSANWASGLYFAQVTKDGAQRMIAISKQ